MHKIKRKLAVLLIVAMSINCFATSVSDNDGSAFITKAEFDALKSSFQAQIDTYNQGIDSKIDEAIASYLSGITIAKEFDRNILFNFGDILCMDSAKPLRYGLGKSYIEGLTGQAILQNTTAASTNLKGTQNRLINIGGNSAYWGGDTNPAPFKKLLVGDIDTTKHIAKWIGYSTDGREHVGFGVRQDLQTSNFWNCFPNPLPTYDKISFHATQLSTSEYNVNGATWANWNSGGWFYRENWNDISTEGHQGRIFIEAFEQSNPTIIYDNLFLFSDANVWELQSGDAVTGCAYISNWNGGTSDPGWIKTNKLRPSNSEIDLSKDEFVDWFNDCFANTTLFFTEANVLATPGVVLKETTAKTWDGRSLNGGATYFHFPMVANFESGNTPKIDAWSKVYNSSYDGLATEYSSMTPVPNAVLTGKDGKKHMALTAGYPLLKVDKSESFTYKIKVKGTFHNLRLFAKAYPFDVSSEPNAESDKSKFFILSGDKGATWNNTNKYLKIVSNETTVNFEMPSSITDSCYVWLKWCADDSTTLSTDEHGIELELESTAHVKSER